MITDMQNLTILSSPVPHIRLVVGARRNLNDPRDPTMPFEGRFVIRGPGLATINLPSKFEVSISIHYDDMKGDTKCPKRGCFGVAKVTRGH